MRAGSAPGPQGLTPREQEIMDRWDAGEPTRRIATAMGLDSSYVVGIVSTYSFERIWSVGDRLDAATRAASVRLAAALDAAGLRA